ncbi:MAG: hypothetical protein IJE57_06305 [Anaerotignum sp.]|nr:hypothetical protein [Anaerotignum sp.]
MGKVYVDVESREKLPVIEGKEIVSAGKRFDPFVMTCEENGFTSLQRRRGINLIWEGMLPKVDFYPVPSLTLFAHDGRGGYFAHNGRVLMEAKIYFVSEKLECWYLAENFRAFVQMAVFEPNWKEKITEEKNEIDETEEKLKDFGMMFGLSAPDIELSENIVKESQYKIFENIEKAREKMSIL